MKHHSIKTVTFLCAAITLLLCFSCRSVKHVEVDPFATSIRPSVTGSWILIEMNEGGTQHRIADGTTFVLPEEPRNAIGGFSGVNHYNGFADIYEHTVVMGNIASTKMAGPLRDAEAERTFLRLLSDCNYVKTETTAPTDETELASVRLILENKEKGIRLVFVK